MISKKHTKRDVSSVEIAQSYPYSWATREKVRWALRTVLIGYKIEKSKDTSTTAKV